jgi:hypothetical protein
MSVETVRKWRRKSPRVPIISSCQVKHSRSEQRLVAVDLSESGLRLRCEGTPPGPGLHLQISLQLHGIDETFELVGRVCERGQKRVRCKGYRGPVHTVGVEILEGSERHLAMLRALVGLRAPKGRKPLPGLPPH